MRTNKKKNIKLAVLILILFLGIGFAALTANLKIDGTLNVSRTSWDVHFENVSITQGSVTANPAPTSNNTDTTEMTYTINFTKPGDYFEFTTDIVNDGTIDAMVDVVSNNAYANASSTTPISLPTYLTSTLTYDDGVPIAQNQELLHGTSEKIKVRVEFKKNIEISDLPSSGDTSIVFKFIGDYKQADENAIAKPVVVLPEGKTKNNLEVGDVIKIKNEEFNFIRYDGNDIVMLAKYNLKVGCLYNYDNGYNLIKEYTSDDEGYGLQSSEVRGYVEGTSIINGVVFFSTNDYWTYWDGVGVELLEPYTANDTIYYDFDSYRFRYRSDDSIVFPTVYDNWNYDGEPEIDEYGFPTNPSYSVAYYVDAYETVLREYGAEIKDTRLLTYEEATDSSIGCSKNSEDYPSGSCPTDGFITNTTFWLGSAYDVEAVWNVYSNGYFYGEYGSDARFGVRPVVVISKSDI